jgi:hypothetical protein
MKYRLRFTHPPLALPFAQAHLPLVDSLFHFYS